MQKLLPVLFLLGLAGCSLDKVEEMEAVQPFAVSFPVGVDQYVSVEGLAEAVDNDGYIVSGTLFGGSSNTLFILKTSTTGSIQKVVTNFGSFNTFGGRLLKTGSGNYAVIGSQDFGGQSAMLVAVFDKNLNKLWSSTYDLNTEFGSYGVALAEAANGDLIAAGNYDSGVIPGELFLMQVTASTGAEVLKKTVDVPGAGFYRMSSIARNGNTYGLLCYNAGLSIQLPAFVKLDNNLELLLSKNLSNGGGNTDGDIMPGSADGFVAAHGLLAQLARNSFLVSMNGNGDEGTPLPLWDNYIDSYCMGCTRNAAGQFLPFGWATITSVASGGLLQAAATRVDADNTVQGSYLYPNTAQQSVFKASCFLSDGGYLFAGNYGDDLLLVKLDNNFNP